MSVGDHSDDQTMKRYPFGDSRRGAFLLWRGTRRAETRRGVREGTQIPSTEEASADPVEDSGVAEVKPDRRA
jgi:hypothetical protein